MKKFLFLSVIYLVVSLNTLLEEKTGPAYNAKNGGTVSCGDRNVLYRKKEEEKIKANDEWLDEIDGADVPGGVSDCVDLQLWEPSKNMYYDHCCYVRFQQEGKMHAGCIGLSEEHYLDISTTMKRMEKGEKNP